MALLQDQMALVTGGTRGIGRAIVEKFINEGAKVALTYRSSSKQANEIISEYGEDKVTAYQSDASSFSAAEELIKDVTEDYGTIDILVNNAGITRDNLILRMTEEQWDEVLENNLKSIFNMCKHVMRPMMKARKGSIINISSVVGIFGNAGQVNYAASKSGVHGFTKSLAKEVGSRNIRCNAIAPGFIETEMTENLDDKTRQNFLSAVPLNRYGSAEEVADLAAYLASGRSAYITGQVISICGGLSM